jgi:hypothetical protein
MTRTPKRRAPFVTRYNVSDERKRDRRAKVPHAVGFSAPLSGYEHSKRVSTQRRYLRLWNHHLALHAFAIERQFDVRIGRSREIAFDR